MAVVTLGDLNDPKSRKRSAHGESGGGPHKNVKAKRVDYEVDEDADYDPKAHISGEDEDEPAKEVRRRLSGKKRGESTKNANAEEVLVISGKGPENVIEGFKAKTHAQDVKDRVKEHDLGDKEKMQRELVMVREVRVKWMMDAGSRLVGGKKTGEQW